MNSILFAAILAVSTVAPTQGVAAADGQVDNKPIQAKPLWTKESVDEMEIVRLSPDGVQIATCYEHGPVTIYNTMQPGPERLLGEGLAATEFSVGAMEFLQDSKWLVAFRESNELIAWDLTTGRQLDHFETGDVIALFTSIVCDEARLLLKPKFGNVGVWSIPDGRLIRAHPVEPRIQGASLGSDGERYFAWDSDGNITAWPYDPNRDSIVFRHQRPIKQLVQSKDARRILTCSFDRTTRLWDIESGEELLRIQTKHGAEGCLLTEDQKQIVTWEVGGVIRVYNVRDKSMSLAYRHGGSIHVCLLSNMQRRIISIGWDTPPKIWRYDDDASPIELQHKGVVAGATLTKDESRLLTWGEDGIVRMWSLPGGELLTAFEHGEEVTEAELRADDSRLLTVSAHAAKVWAVPGEEK